MKEKKKGGRSGYNTLHYTLMIIPGLVWIVMFSIVPMVGIVMAFEDFSPSKGWFGSPWVGLENFEYLSRLKDVRKVLVNTHSKSRSRRSFICPTLFLGSFLRTSFRPCLATGVS